MSKVLTVQLVFFVVALFILQGNVQAGAMDNVYLLEAPEDMPFNEWRVELQSRGIVLAHAFPPAGGLVVSDDYIEPELFDIEESLNTRVYYDNPEGQDEERIRSTREGDLLWHAHRKLTYIDADDEQINMPHGAPLIDDALVPDLSGDETTDFFGSCSSTSLKYSSSEYLLGNVSVNVILPESNGGIDTQTENWTLARETSVSNEITEGLNDLRNLYSLTTSLKPSFTYHYYFGRTNSNAQTSYEPITRNAAPTYNDCSVGEGLWACEILNKLGYSSFSGYAKAREFNGDTRIADGTDWVFSIFVVDSYNDTDGKFPDNRFGYAWLGGPWVVMTYDNDGWGISQMNNVTRHEANHIFYAVDEYSASACTCTQVAGYINYTNQNCQNSCSSNVSCVMRDNVAASCYYTRGQVGWGDLDSDTIPDPIDINPQTTINAYTPDPTSNIYLTYTGTATIQKLTNNNLYNYKCDMNILTIANVQYRVDGGSWQNASASDGSFNSATENYTFTAGPLGSGTHTIETRAVDELGQTDATNASDTVTVNAPMTGPPGVQDGDPIGEIPMTATKVDPLANQINLTWDNSCVGANYEVIVGPGSGLPTSYGGIYLIMPGFGWCNMGVGPTFTWMNAIDPLSDPTRFFWWLIVATDGAMTTEGAWGKNSGNIERTGPGVLGSSTDCGIMTKDITNTCGQ